MHTLRETAIRNVTSGENVVIYQPANLYDCMRNAVAFGIPREQAVLSATAIPARAIGRQDEIGIIADGLYADFVVCGEDLTRQAVYLGGSLL